MPLVAHSALPAFSAIAAEGTRVVFPGETGDRPALRVGFLNLMPDAALQATERQFIRLVAAFGDRADLYVQPFAVASAHRGPAARAHIGSFYDDFEAVRRRGLDALIITGANPSASDITAESFWEPLLEVLDWARDTGRSTLCSCLAAHAVLKRYSGVERKRLPRKRWGVYAHESVDTGHPWLRDVSAPLRAPHSHNYDIGVSAMEAAGVEVLISSAEAGVYLAVPRDEPGWLLFQGHPEYDADSLLKECKREVFRFSAGERGYPPLPEHYFTAEARDLLSAHRERVERAVRSGGEPPPFPESELTPLVTDPWQPSSARIYRSWLGEVLVRAGGSD